ncbi:MAG: hypothetical protein K2K74_12805, partial [Lachnospiraceae bacterium]|nr:hypothetical protein [Lachnospiraceae bacterium]
MSGRQRKQQYPCAGLNEFRSGMPGWNMVRRAGTVTVAFVGNGGIIMKKNMSIREMWHYIIFQTKGYRTLKAAIVLGALTAAAVPYGNNLFYACILDSLVLAKYDTAVRIVVWMVIVTLVLKLAAKGCERIVNHYCKPCAEEIKKRTAQKAFSMEYGMIDQKETLEAFRRVRAGEIGMGGVERQLLAIYAFFQELAGIILASGFVLVLFARTDRAKESMTVSLFLPALMLLIFVLVMVLSNYFSQKEGVFRVDTELKNEQVNTLSAYLLNLINRETYVKDIRLFGLKDYLYKKTEGFRTVGRMYTECGSYSGKCQALPTFAAQMF